MSLLSVLASLLTSETPQNYLVTEVPSREDAIKAAYVWVSQDPENRSWSNIQGSGSMRPQFDGNAISLLEKSDGSNVKKGDLVVFKRASDGAPAVIHAVAALNDTSFISDGIANKHYDGWSPRSNIKWKANIVKWTPKPVDSGRSKP
jgi:hypothetical protein